MRAIHHDAAGEDRLESALDELLGLVVDNYIEVCDPVRLREQMVYQNLRLQAEYSAPAWVPVWLLTYVI